MLTGQKVFDQILRRESLKEIYMSENTKKLLQIKRGVFNRLKVGHPNIIGLRTWSEIAQDFSFLYVWNKTINPFSEEIQDLKKQRPKKKDDEINPIWETLLKVIFDVTRLKGDIRNARLDKFLKEAQFDRKQSVCGKYRVYWYKVL